MNRKKIIRWAKILLLVYCIIGIAIYGLQDYIMFRPVAVDKSHKYDFKIPYREVNLPYSSDVNINVVQFTTTDSVPKGVVLYFHGNRRNISWYAKNAPVFTRNGYEVWMLDYPGSERAPALSRKRNYTSGHCCYTSWRGRATSPTVSFSMAAAWAQALPRSWEQCGIAGN
jgi:hypothetical protein